MADIPDRTDELVFDDEPLDRILYGSDLPGPTTVDAYLPIKEFMDELRSSRDAPERMTERIADIFDCNLQLHKPVYLELLKMMQDFVPNQPNPLLRGDISPLQRPLESIWRLANERDDPTMIEAAGTILYRWYEHNNRYEDARLVLMRLINEHVRYGNRLSEAICRNNLGFEFLFEQNWSEALSAFKSAAKQFRQNDVKDVKNYLNAVANCLTCRFELRDYDSLDAFENEVHQTARSMRGNGCWHERKPLILGARIAEQVGRYDDAIDLVEAAIESSKESNTIWQESDQKYLMDLKSRRKSKQLN